jgi:hypothetical protein
MSSEYMRQIMESIDRAQIVTEGYEERVQQVVDFINNHYDEGLVKKDFEKAINMAGNATGVLELRGQSFAGHKQKIGDSRKDFIKDVAAKIKFKRDTSKTDNARANKEQVLRKLGHVIGDAVGMSFPDGDPFDHIYPAARKLGVPANDMLKWLDVATKKAGMGRTYYDYLRSLWQDQYDDAKGDFENLEPGDRYYNQAKERYEMMGGDRFQNPWG